MNKLSTWEKTIEMWREFQETFFKPEVYKVEYFKPMPYEPFASAEDEAKWLASYKRSEIAKRKRAHQPNRKRNRVV